MPYPGPISLFSFLPHAILICPPHELFVLPFNFENVSETFVYECLEFSCCCLGYSPCFVVVDLVTLLFSWLLSCSLVVLVTLHVSEPL